MDPLYFLVGFIILILLALIFLKQKSSKSELKQEEEHPEAARENRRLIVRNRLRRNHPNNRRNEDEVNFNDNNNDNLENNSSQEEDLIDQKSATEREELRKRVGTKKLAKMEEKAARKERNDQILREREEKKEKEERMYQERKQKEEEEERLEKLKEEEENKIKEEQEKREYEEYLKLKEQFTVDEEGQDLSQSALESENLLMEFVNFIKTSKIVVLEDLAAEFKLRTQDVINRIIQVQEMGLLTGVMDDRGKFIYVSEEELLNVKKFIELRGRVSIIELAKHSNELISLKSSLPTDVAS